jgi:hypothetical protein
LAGKEEEVKNKVARWFIFKPKIPIWLHLRGPWNGKFYDHLDYFMAFWYILWHFDIFYGIFV